MEFGKGVKTIVRNLGVSVGVVSKRCYTLTVGTNGEKNLV